MEYLLHIAILVGFYALLAIALNLLVGNLGVLALSHGAFCAVGAYAAALCSVRHGAGMIVTLPLSLLIGVVTGGVLVLPATRLRGQALTLITFAFQIVVGSLLYNWADATNGPMGIPGIDRRIVANCVLRSNVAYAALVAVILGFAVRVSYKIATAPFGRLMHSVREDPVFTTAIGKSLTETVCVVFMLSGSMAGIAGGLYAHYMTFIDPSSFTFAESLFVLSAVILGGAGSLWGPVLGAVVLVTLPELLRFVGIPSAAAANIRQILYGLALVACMLWRPQGLIGEYAFGREAKEK